MLTPEKLPTIPPRPWSIYVTSDDGDFRYQVRSADGFPVGEYVDSEYPEAGTAVSIAAFVAAAANGNERTVVHCDFASGIDAVKRRLAALGAPR